MNKEWEWRLRYSRLHGELLGIMNGMVRAWKIPEELSEIIIKFVEDKEEEYNKIMNEEEGIDSDNSEL